MFNESLRSSETNYIMAESNLIRVLQPNKDFFSASPKSKQYDKKRLMVLSTIVNKILGVGNYPGFKNEEYEHLTIQESADLIQTSGGPVLFARRASYGDISVQIGEYIILLNQDCNKVIDIRYANALKGSEPEEIDIERRKMILDLARKNWTSLLNPNEEFRSVKDLKNRTEILKISTEILQRAVEKN